MKHAILTILLLAFSAQLQSSELRYVNDVLVVQLRTGPTFSHRILKGLPSGTKLTLLETTDEDKWARVKAGDELEGWVPTQYLSTEPAARDILISVNRKLENVEQENVALKKHLAEIKASADQTGSELSSISQQKESLASELEHIKEVSSNAIQLDQDNKKLLLQNQTLKNEVDVLTTENQRLKDAKNSNEFMNGAYAVLIGVFITLMVPRLWPKKRDDWA